MPKVELPVAKGSAKFPTPKPPPPPPEEKQDKLKNG